MTNDKPVSEHRDGAVKAAVFEREYEYKGAKFKSQSVNLQIGYKDSENDWQNMNLTVVKKNLAQAIRVLTLAAKDMGVMS